MALAAVLRAAQARPYCIAVEPIWQAGRPTSLVCYYRAPLAALDRVLAQIAADGCNAVGPRVTANDTVTWHTSQALPA